MNILGIDTSSDVCSVALLKYNELICELNKNDSKTHSENLMPLIDELLKKANLTLSDVNLIACDIGPGSFTGIRIGIGTAKAIAEFRQIPVASVTSLETLAYSVSGFDTIVSLIDCKNSQVYCGIFDRNYKLLEDYIADSIQNAIKHIMHYSNICFVGDGAILHKGLLKNNFNNISFAQDNTQSAFNLGKCAYEKYISRRFKNCRHAVTSLSSKISSRKDERVP